MLEEGEHHRGRGTPASQVKHDYLAEAAGTPDSLGELNLLDSLDEYNEDSSTVDASAADVDAIARSVSATPPLVTTIYPPPLADGYGNLHYPPDSGGGANDVSDRRTDSSLSVMQTSAPEAAADDADDADDADGDYHLSEVYDSEEESETVLEEIVEEVSSSSDPYDDEEDGGVASGAAPDNDDGSNYGPSISSLSTPPTTTVSRVPLSPFSPAAPRPSSRRRRRGGDAADDLEEERWSLVPCRKVSVLVRVKPPRADWDGGFREREEEEARKGWARKAQGQGHRQGDRPRSRQSRRPRAGLATGPVAPSGASASTSSSTTEPPVALCVFPLTPRSEKSQKQQPAPGGDLTPVSHTLSEASACATPDLVVVNPTAFGSRFPAELTMETARLVAEVGRGIDSEDWIRRYRFDRVLWPDDSGGSMDQVGRNGRGGASGGLVEAGHLHSSRSNETLVALAAAIADDALSRGVSSVCACLGEAGSGRSYSAFGTAAFGAGHRRSTPTLPTSFEGEGATDRILDALGMLGLVTAELIERRSGEGNVSATTFTLSVMELTVEGSLRDALHGLDEGPGPALRLTRPDRGGAIVKNLGEMPVNSLVDIQVRLLGLSVACQLDGHISEQADLWLRTTAHFEQNEIVDPGTTVAQILFISPECLSFSFALYNIRNY